MTKVPRLLDTFTPNHYNLTLDLTRAEEKEFSGTVIISGDSTSESILLHSKGLTIQSAIIDNQPADVSFGEFGELRLSQPNLKNGNHTIHIIFPEILPTQCTACILVILLTTALKNNFSLLNLNRTTPAKFSLALMNQPPKLNTI